MSEKEVTGTDAQTETDVALGERSGESWEEVTKNQEGKVTFCLIYPVLIEGILEL